MAVSNKALAIAVGVMTLILIPLLVMTIITFVDVKNNPKASANQGQSSTVATVGTSIMSGTTTSGVPQTGSTMKTSPTPTTKTTPKTQPTTTSGNNSHVKACQTTTCLNSANTLSSGMDLNADPCQDFYQYVCGQWIQSHPLKNGESSVSSFGDVQDLINDLIAKNLSQVDLYSTSIAESIRTAAYVYQSCQMSGQEYPNPAELMNIINNANPEINFQTNGWPMITANWSGPTDVFNLGTLIADLDTLYLLPTLLNSYVTVDIKNVAKNMLYLAQATLGLGPREYYIDPLFNDVLLDYRELITNVSYIMCNNQTGGCDFSKEELRIKAQQIVDFEVSIARKTISPTELRNYTSQFNNFTMFEITRRFVSEKFAWTDYFKHLLLHNFDKFPSTDYIVIAEPGYVDQMIGDLNYFNDDEIEVVINYLIWRFVFDNMAFVTNNPGESYIRLKAKVKGLKDLPPSPSDCANVIINYMPYVAGYIYVWNVIPDSSVLVMDVTDMINNILSSFSAMLSQLSWYDATSLNGAQKKITDMQRNVAYPPQSLYTSYLDSYYKVFLDIPSKTELKRYLDVLNYVKSDVQEITFQQLLSPGDRTNFQSSPALVNAWYQPNLNSITFPAAILNPPYYKLGNPKVLNYGALGHVMGHELSHAFDDEGTQFNQDGTLSTWMTPNTQRGFQQQADCIQSEYNQFCYPQQYDYVCVNGINTQGENIADNGGIVAAYNAYKTYEKLHGAEAPLPGMEQFSSDQLFFISNAHIWCSVSSPLATTSQVLTDVHSPAYYRVFGTYKNFDAFGEAFNCKRGDPYYPYPEDQCPLYQPSSTTPKTKSSSKQELAKSFKAKTEVVESATATTCTTAGCQAAANLIINAMNSTVNPCDNFYEFSCGNWVKNTALPAGIQVISAAYQQQMAIMTNVTNYLETNVTVNSTLQSKAVQTAKIIYDSCMNSKDNSVNELLAVVQDLTKESGWPIIVPNWKKSSKFSAEALISELDAYFGIPTLLSSIVDADLINPSVYSLGITQASLALGYRQYYIDPRYTQNLQDYTQLIINVAQQLADDTGSNVTMDSIMMDAQTIVNMEVELARKTAPRDDSRNYAVTYHPYNLTMLQKRWPFFGWTDYLDTLLYNTENPDTIKTFVIMNTGYVDELHGDWNYQLSVRDYTNYLIWRYVYNNLMFIGPTYKQLFLDFQAKRRGSINALPPPQDFCSNLIMDSMPYVAGDIFLKVNPPSSTIQASTYTTATKNAFSSMLNDLQKSGWLDRISATNAQNKLSKLLINIGYLNNIDPNSLDGYYAKLIDMILNDQSVSINNFFQNWNAIQNFNAYKDFTQVGKSVDKNEFVISSAMVGALYIPKRNVLNVAAGAMTPPFYRQDFPNSTIFGAFGSLVGHEILQGFNDLGVQLNQNGGLGQLYTEETMDKFSLMAQCLIGQYGQDCYPEQNYLCVDGTNTQGENIADNGGLISAYKAYENFLQKYGAEPNLPGLEQYSNKQIFFMSYGQSMCEKATDTGLQTQLELNPHPPNKDRVNGAVKNFDEFSQVFQCKSGDAMSPPENQQCYVYVPPYTPPPPTTPPPHVSNAPGWQAAATSLESSVNTTLDPCDDFYKFACDDWIRSNHLGKSEVLTNPIVQLQSQVYESIGTIFDNIVTSNNNSIPDSVRTAAQAYQACKVSNFATYANLTFIVNALTDAIGGWPMILKDYVPPTTGQNSIFADIGSLEAAYLLPTLFKSGVDVDWTNVQRPALFIDEATLVLERDYYINPLYHGYLDAYELLIFETSYQICHSINCGVSNETMRNYTKDIVAFETNIARKKVPINERRNMQSVFNEYNYTSLTNRFKGIDWNDYLTSLLATLKVSNFTTAHFDYVIMSPGYVDQLSGDVLVDASFENLTTIINYLGWRLVNQNLLFFSNSTLPPSPGSCVGLVDTFMPFAVGNVYVNSLLSTINYANQQADFLTQIISNSFTGLFTQLTWQDDPTKSNAVQKLGYMVQNFGYPDWMLNKIQLDTLYANYNNLILNKNYDFWQILNRLRYSTAQLNFQQLTQSQPMSRNAWPISPAQAAAVYVPQRNAFSVGAALFNQPFYDSGYPQAVNYGSLGTILGHELVHAFDDVGVQYSSNGTLKMWMSPQSYYNFSIVADCVINKYNTYCYPDFPIDMCVNGINTQGENIADIGGLEAAYRAYESYVGAYGEEPRLPGELEKYTMEQVFFMSYARGLCSNIEPNALRAQLQGDVQTPAKFRVNGAFMNFYKFGEAFDCPVGSPMFPPTRDVCPVYEIPPNPPFTAQSTSSTSTTTSMTPPKADNSTGYLDAEENIFPKLNQSINPCNDFYGFACGTWVKKNQATQKQSIIDIYSQIQMQINHIIAEALLPINTSDASQPSSIRNAATIYQTCMTDHSDDGEKILSAINDFPNVNGWPIISPNWMPNPDFDPFQITGLLDSNFLIPTLLESAVNVDWKSHTKNSLYIQQGNVALGDREFYMNPYFSNVMAEYQQLIVNTASYLNSLNANVSESQIIDDAQSIINFETNLARKLKTTYEERDFTSMYNPFTLNELPNRYRHIGRNPWTNYLNALLEGSGTNWTLQTTAIVTQPGYIDELDGDVANFQQNQRDYANYLMWRFVFAHLQFLPDMETQYNQFYKVWKGVAAAPPESLCVDVVNAFMPYVTGFIYMQQDAFIDEDMVLAETVLDYVKNQTKFYIEYLPFMDNITRDNLFRKLDNVIINLGYPALDQDITQLNTYYNYLDSIRSYKDYWAVLHFTQYFTALNNFKSFQKQPNLDQFESSPAVLLADYSYPKNSITVPLVSMESPFGQSEYPFAVNFGGLGVFIARQFAHAFDDIGIQFDYNGILNPDWIPDYLKDNFDLVSQCVVTEYGQQCYPQPTVGLCVNGINTMEENQADIFASAISYLAYNMYVANNTPDGRLPGLEQYTPDQIYFMSYAQQFCENATPEGLQRQLVMSTYSPGRERVNTALRNVFQFGKSFNCKRGDYMYPPVDQMCFAN